MKHLRSFLTILCVSLLVGTLLISGCKQDVYTPDPQTPKEQASSLRADLVSSMSTELGLEVTITPYIDKDGNVCFYGTIDDELDSLLPSLVDAYNTEAHPQEPLDVATVRYGLTDDIKNTSYQSSRHQGVIPEFFIWVNSPADLVYAIDTPHPDGSVSYAGDPVSGNITNYNYVVNQNSDAYHNYTYADQYTGPTQ